MPTDYASPFVSSTQILPDADDLAEIRKQLNALGLSALYDLIVARPCNYQEFPVAQKAALSGAFTYIYRTTRKVRIEGFKCLSVGNVATVDIQVDGTTVMTSDEAEAIADGTWETVYTQSDEAEVDAGKTISIVITPTGTPTFTGALMLQFL